MANDRQISLHQRGLHVDVDYQSCPHRPLRRAVMVAVVAGGGGGVVVVDDVEVDGGSEVDHRATANRSADRGRDELQSQRMTDAADDGGGEKTGDDATDLGGGGVSIEKDDGTPSQPMLLQVLWEAEPWVVAANGDHPQLPETRDREAEVRRHHLPKQLRRTSFLVYECCASVVVAVDVCYQQISQSMAGRHPP